MTGPIEARLLRLAGPPGLIDSAAIEAGVARRLGFSGLPGALLQRLLARAAGGEAGAFAGGALPLAASFAFDGSDPAAAATVVRQAPQTLPPSAGSAPPEAPPRLVRVARRGRPSDSAPAVLIRGAATPDPLPGDTAGGAAAAMQAAVPRRVSEMLDGGEGAAGGTDALPLARPPGPRAGDAAPSDRDPDRLAPVISRASAPPGGGAPEPTASAAPRAAAGGASSPVPGPSAPRSAPAAAIVPLPQAASLPSPSANRAPSGRAAAVSELRRPAAPRRPEIGTATTPSARRAVVAELPLRPRPQPQLMIPLPVAAAPRRPEIGARAAHPAGNTAVAELPRRARPAAPLVLPERSIEAPRRAAASGPSALPIREPALPDRMLMEPDPARPTGSKPAAALSGPELDRLADKVSRIIARRVAVERERRGR